MNLSVCFLLSCVIIWVNAGDECAEQTVSIDSVADSISGVGIQLLLAKLNQLQHTILELQYELHEHRGNIRQNQATQEKIFDEFLGVIHHLNGRVNLLENNIGRNLSVLQDRSWQILAQQTACANHDALREKLFDLMPKQNQSVDVMERMLLSNNSSLKLRKQDYVTTAPEVSSTPAISATPPVTLTIPKIEQPYPSCKDVVLNVSGTYLIRAKSGSEPFPVFCEQQQFGGGWLVFQYRYDGSVDFYRNWSEYKNGFGDIKKEFWLGLEKLHQLTSVRLNELIVELKDFSGTYKYARYDGFEIGSEVEQYSLKTLGKYSGTAGDSLEYQKGMKFSTKDRDNDQDSSINCAELYEGAWWHNSCHYSHLNGRYLNANNSTSNSWFYFNYDYQGMRFSRMMIRPVE